MEAEAVDCNNCGAPLEVLESTNFATCNHCGSRLRILREASATFSQQIAAERQSLDRSYSLTPHQPNYLLAYSLRNDPNRPELGADLVEA